MRETGAENKKDGYDKIKIIFRVKFRNSRIDI